MKLRAIGDSIICTDADFGDQTTEAGIVIKSNVEKAQGITPRWFRIVDTGPDVDGRIKPGMWVLVSYGRWTPMFQFQDDREPNNEKFWKVDPEGCLALATEKPSTLYYNSNTVTADKKTRV